MAKATDGREVGEVMLHTPAEADLFFIVLGGTGRIQTGELTILCGYPLGSSDTETSEGIPSSVLTFVSRPK